MIDIQLYNIQIKIRYIILNYINYIIFNIIIIIIILHIQIQYGTRLDSHCRHHCQLFHNVDC